MPLACFQLLPLYPKMVNFIKVWGVASEDVGSRDRCRQAPMDGFAQHLNPAPKFHSPLAMFNVMANLGAGFTAVLDRYIPYLLFLDGFSIKRE